MSGLSILNTCKHNLVPSRSKYLVRKWRICRTDNGRTEQSYYIFLLCILYELIQVAHTVGVKLKSGPVKAPVRACLAQL